MYYKFNQFLIIFLSIILIQSCGGGGNSAVAPVADSRAEKLYPTVLPNESAEPNTVEVSLTAGKTFIDFGIGVSTQVWAYNGVIPGPTIEANVGDKVIVHLINNLDEPTTIHYHGVELPANMDGSNISQRAVQPGETFTYTFTVTRAATYWYHPHARSNVQVEKGLYGAFIVRDKAEDKKLKLPIQEHLLVLDDVLLDDNSEIAPEFSSIPSIKAIELLNGREGNVLLVNGKVNPKIRLKRGVPNRLRFINASNSRFMRLSILKHVMWRIGGDAGLISTSLSKQPIGEVINARFRDPQLTPNSPIQPEYISDQDPVKGILLTPGERAEVVFTPNTTDDIIELEWHDIHRGRHIVVPTSTSNAVIRPKHGGTPPPGPGDPPPGAGTTSKFKIVHDDFDGVAPHGHLATFELYGENNRNFYNPPEVLRTVKTIEEASATGPIIKIIYGHSQPDDKGDVTFFIKAKMAPNPNFDSTLPVSATNLKMKLDQSFPFDLVTPKIADMVKPNETRIIEIINMTGGDHNFHLHGFMFQLLDTRLEYDDAPEKNRTTPALFTENKDTIIIAKRPGALGVTRSITRLIVTFDSSGREILASGKEPTATTSGGWVMHCHFLEHSAKGMMSYIQVTP